ncbi:TlpA family protein disulfide reductase [Chryseobacterium terrae]|uniref:TlpA disulfide reductase family protein n=1 Tax=Chryseobacterium terrae TaxID=3163299 RepID=A0ABW8XY69_9FLAO
MKKIILTAILATTLIGCKKEAEKTEENISVTDSIDIQKTPEEIEAPKIALKEVDQKGLTEILSKKNDTLYVTNFFATWCGPCMMEMPHFKKKIEELKGKPVKFTFINIYNKPAWDTEVPAFAKQSGLSDKILLLDDSKLNHDFFENFKQWDGNNIPFTFFRKGDKAEESIGSMTEEMLNSQIDSFLK